MRKQNLTYKGTKVLCCILTASMLIMGTAACGSGGQTGQAESQGGLMGGGQDASGQAETVVDSVVEEAESLYGQITKLEGSKIILALAEEPSVPRMDGAEGMPGREAPEGAPGEMPGREAPEGATSQKPDGVKPGGKGRDMELTLTGETRTIQISDTTIISVNGEEASVSDLEVDDIVVVLMDGDTVNSVTAGRVEK